MIDTLLPDYVADRLGWLLIHSLWQLTLIAVGTSVALRLMRHASATSRYWTCLLALSAMTLGPAISWWFLPAYPQQASNAPALEARVDSGHARGDSQPVDVATTSSTNTAAGPIAHETARRYLEAAPVEAAVAEFESSRPASADSAWRGMLESIVSPWLKQLVLAWCLGVLLFALRPLRSWHTLHRLRRIGVSPVAEPASAALARAAARLGVRPSVTALQSSLAPVPMVIGYLRPVILLPVYVVSGLSSAQIEAILAHELAHVRRHDYLVNLFQIVLETICFYHPAVWWLSARLRQEREHCCDELAASAIDSRAAYGRALLALEELRGKPPVLAMAATSGSLVERIQRLRAAQSSDRAGAGGLIGIALLATTIMAVCIGSASQADGVSSAPTQPASTASESATVNDWDEKSAAGTVQGILVKASDGNFRERGEDNPARP